MTQKPIQVTVWPEAAKVVAFGEKKNGACLLRPLTEKPARAGFCIPHVTLGIISALKRVEAS